MTALGNIREWLSYSPDTGNFTWLQGRKTGRTAGGRVWRFNRWYLVVGWKDKTYLAHRLAWWFMTGDWPPEGTVIDHINHNSLDNRFENLRAVSQTINCHNRHAGVRTSRFLGVSRCPNTKTERWVAQIRKDNKNHYIGLFPDEETAARARDAIAVKLYGPHARLNFPMEGV